MGDLLRPGEAAELLGSTTETLRRWVEAKRIKALVLPSGHLRIPQAEVDRIRMTGEFGGE
jgi:excisionase family DNA binding protein